MREGERGASTSAAVHAFVVLRASGHSGSRWLAELLATQHTAFLFEFPGRCSQRRYPAKANASMHDIFRTACACRLDAAMDAVCPSDEAGRIRSMACVKDAYCADRCPRRRPMMRVGDCAAVGMIDSYQPALARRIAAAARSGEAPIAIATFERDNAAKHAMSKLRTQCGGTALKGNHVKAPPTTANPADATRPAVLSLMHVAPRLFRAEADQSLLGRRRLREGVASTFGAPRYALHYEDLQMGASAAMRALLAAVGVATFDEAALARSALRKGSSEDLRRTLLNFDDLHDSLAEAPCLQHMLAAPAPQRFDAGCGATDSGGGAHQAKQDAAVRVLRCGASGTCTVTRMNRLATSAVADAARAAGQRGRRKQRRLGTFTPTRHGANASLTAAEKVVAGECTNEEHGMCARALGRVSRSQAAVDSEAELCVLRHPDDPLGL